MRVWNINLLWNILLTSQVHTDLNPSHQFTPIKDLRFFTSVTNETRKYPITNLDNFKERGQETWMCVSMWSSTWTHHASIRQILIEAEFGTKYLICDYHLGLHVSMTQGSKGWQAKNTGFIIRDHQFHGFESCTRNTKEIKYLLILCVYQYQYFVWRWEVMSLKYNEIPGIVCNWLVSESSNPVLFGLHPFCTICLRHFQYKISFNFQNWETDKIKGKSNSRFTTWGIISIYHFLL